FVTSVDRTSGREFQLNLKNSDSNWMNKLEIQTTGMLPSTSDKNRNPTAFFRNAAYVSLYIIDSGGNPAGDGSFWIRIYKWN
ncbi:MAG: hypothetical protein N4A74_11320, partial [Carboxylicivirga sp.]|nr:hypothetical protein [Carboxylicivirga sp.]